MELHSYDEQNKTYTGVDWGGATITLTSTDQTDSQGGDSNIDPESSDSQGLINVGIIAVIIIILLSGAAIISMRHTTDELKHHLSSEQKEINDSEDPCYGCHGCENCDVDGPIEDLID